MLSYALVANSNLEKIVSLSVSPQQRSEFRGKVILSVPPPPYKHGLYYSGPLTTEEWIEQAKYIGADGISMHMSHFSNNSTRESIKPALQEYRDAGLLTSLVWDSHGAPYYNLRFNPPLHYWSMDNQHKQGVHYWRVFIDSGSPEVKTFRYGLWHENDLNDPTIVQNGDGSVTVKVANLDYYTPAYGGGVTYNISSVYNQYSASKFSWLYDETGVNYDPRDTQYEQGNRLDYGLDYDIFVANNSLYAKVHTPNNREFNLYVLMYYPGHPSVVIPEGKDVYLDTYRNFLTSFSGLASAHVQNDGGFPVLTKEGDFHPEIIMQVEAKYGIDFNFDNWVVYQRAHYDWDLKHFTQYVFNRENYLVFKDYAREKQDMAHEYGMIYVPSGSDMFFMVEGMIEHVDALMVNTWDGWQHIVARWGHSGGNTAWTPTSKRPGIWETYFIWNTTSGNSIMSWTKAAADELLKWNPDGSTLYYWLGTSNNWNITDRLDDFKAAIQYFHERFRHVSMLPSNVERYTVAKAYPISYSYRYGNNIDLNPGQIDIDIVYAKDLRWDPVPTDGCLIPWSGGVIGHSQTDDMQAHEKIEQAVEGGSGIALSGVKLRDLGEYYKGTDIPSIYKNMFQSAGWTHESKSGVEPHYLTFNGTFDPEQLNDKVGNGHWFQLEANSTANIIVGEHPFAGLYEADYGAGRVIGYGASYDPFKDDLTDATSATYGDEYFVRLVEKAAGKEGSFRLWDVGKTYVYKLDDTTYYALLVERYGFSRNVPLTVYGAEYFRITDMDTGKEIPNNSFVHLEENSTKLFKIKLGVSSEPLDLDSDAGDGYVNLSWEVPLDIGGSAITGYNIYRNGTVVAYDHVSAGQLWYHDINVINGLTYTYNVTAVNKIGEGPRSTDESATPMTLPNAPENLQADAGDGFVNLTWDPPSEDGGSSIIGYNIYRNGATGPYGTTTGETWFYDTGADNGVTYTYNISAVNGMGEGPTDMIRAKPMTIPSSPQNPQIDAGDSIVYITWEASHDDGGSAITGYNIYRSDFPGIYATVPRGQLSYDDFNVVNGVTYIYNISANNSVGEGPRTLDINDIPMDMPSAPQNLLGDAGDGYVNLSWEVPSDNGGSPITGYNIYRNGTSGVYATVPAGQLWFYDDAVNGVEYTYNVSAFNIIGEGADNSTSATPMTVPSTPQNLLATTESGYVVLTWSIPADDGGSSITEYHIYRDGTGTVSQTVSATELSHEDHDVTNGMTYTYYVSASNIVGEGLLSGGASAKAGSGPAVPSNFTVTAGDSYVLLTLDIPASEGGYPVTNYTIYRGTTSGGETLLIVMGNDLTYNDTTTVNDVTYYYRISATNGIAEGTLSNSVSATPEAPVIPVNGPPTSVITSPTEGDNLEGILDISGSSSDIDGTIQTVEIRIDDGNWITVSGTTSWTHSLDTTLLSDGEHTITVRSYDGENYSVETSISVTVADPEEEEEAEPESPLLWILIIVIVLVLVLLLAMRKKKPEEEKTTL